MGSHLPPTGSVWAVSDTANHGVTIARGLLAAATSDDINPVALMCCDSFGSLLPVSPETRLKVEQLARRSHTSHVLNFFKAQVGYKKDDSVDQLSRSDSGIRFLCLVATFCTLNHYDAADRLDALLQATQKNAQIRPTIKQLQVMVSSIDKKLARSDFASSIAGFEIMLRSKFTDLEPTQSFNVAQVPSKSSLQSLILAINELCRIGEDKSFDSLNIRLRSRHAAWTSAFIKWLLGAPPIIRNAKDILFDSEHSAVTLIIQEEESPSSSNKRTFDDFNDGLDVVTSRKTHSLREIFFHEVPNEKKWAWQGLVDAKTWFGYQFAAFSDRFEDVRKPGHLRRAVGQALYFIICRLPDRFCLCSDFKAMKMSLQKVDGKPADLFHDTIPEPFLNKEVRLQVARELLGDHIELVEDSEDALSTLAPENLAKRFKRACRQCRDPQDPMLAGTMPCDVHNFLEHIGEIGATVLTMSLFGSRVESYPMITAGRRFDNNRFHSRLTRSKNRNVGSWKSNWRVLIITGWQDLWNGKCSILSCSPTAIFRHATKLLGHADHDERVIVSSGSGQVLYPAFFEANGILLDGYMQLCAFPGNLQRDVMSFDFLIDAWHDGIEPQDESDPEDDSSDGDDDMEVAEDGTSDLGELSPNLDHPGAKILMHPDGDMEIDDKMSDSNEEELTLAAQAASEPQEIGENTELDAEDASAAVTTTASSSTVGLSPEFSVRPQDPSIKASHMIWKISVRDSILDGELYLDDSNLPVMAWGLLEQVGFAAYTLACGHPRSRPAGPIAQEFLLGSLPVELRAPDWPKTVYDVGRNYSAHLAGLDRQDYYPLTILHHKGCIGCALQLCLDLGSVTVIT